MAKGVLSTRCHATPLKFRAVSKSATAMSVKKATGLNPVVCFTTLFSPSTVRVICTLIFGTTAEDLISAMSMSKSAMYSVMPGHCMSVVLLTMAFSFVRSIAWR